MGESRGGRDELYQQAVAQFQPALERVARAYEADGDKRRDLLQEIHVALWLSLEFYRRELERQRDARQSVWRWYLAPFVPSVAAFTLGFYFAPRGGPLAASMVGGAFAAAFLGVAHLNRRSAARLQRRIDELRS